MMKPIVDTNVNVRGAWTPTFAAEAELAQWLNGHGYNYDPAGDFFEHHDQAQWRRVKRHRKTGRFYAEGFEP